MPKLIRLICSALLLCLCQLPAALAQNQFNLDSLLAGQLLLNISATERVEVDQDTLNISLQYSTTGLDRVALQDEVNTVMTEVLEILQNSTGVEYSIERYQVYMTQSQRNQQAWRAQQSLQLTSKDSAAILDLARELQENDLTMQNMSYSLSTAQYESISDTLLNAALEKLQAKADVAATSLNKNSAELVEVTINGNGGQNFNQRGRVMMMEMGANADSAMATPVAQPGKTEVALTVSARALLSP